MPPDLVIGLDASTTACKAIVWDRQGNAVAEGRAPLPLLTPQPGWHEQSAVAWWEAAVQALRQAAGKVDGRRLAALCITPQRETFVPVDASGEPLRNGILWMDERCRPLLPSLEQTLGSQRFHQLTGLPLSVNLTIGKIAWLREHEPEIFARTAYYLDVHAFLVQRLTWQFRTGWGCASPTGLFDMTSNRWAASLLEPLGIRLDQMPEAYPPGVVLGAITLGAAKLCGLPCGLPVAAGIGDGQSGGLGVAILQPGEAYLALGTSVVSGAYSDRFVTDRAFRTLYGGIQNTYLLETALMGGGYTIAWFLDKFAPSSTMNHYQLLDHYDRAAAEIPAGCAGLMLVPYWNSVLGPYWDASASGIVVGWRGIHGPAHFYRAVLEGIAFEQRLNTQGVETASGQKVARFIAVGGGSRSATWRQIIADITGKPIYRASTLEAAALGAGILAASAVHLFPDTRQAAQSMTHLLPDPTFPDPARHEFYSRLYEEVYIHLYPTLRPYLAKL